MFHTIQLSKNDPTPLYIQLASEMSRLIQNNILPQGVKLPPIRSLSKQLSINRDTVVSAYKLLENQGLVEAYVGKGTYVSQISLIPLPHADYIETNSVCCSTVGFPKELFPISLCKELLDTIIDAEGWAAFNDPLGRERNSLKQKVAAFLEKTGVKASSAQVRIIKNYLQFLQTLFKFSPKQGICIEETCDLTYPSYLRSIGAKVYEVPLNASGMDTEVLEKHLRSGNVSYIILSTYLQNPTGLCYSKENKLRIIELAELYDCYIIEDGTLSDFVSIGIPLLPLFSYFSKDRVIYIYHFSKVYLPHFSYSFALLPNPMLKCIPDTLECTLSEYFLRYYLDSDFLEKNRHWMISSCQAKYNQLYKGLSLLEDTIETYASHGGIFFWLKPKFISCDEVCDFLTQHNIIVAPGSLFTYTHRSQYFRLSISQLSFEHIEIILHLLKQQLNVQRT